MNYVAAVMVNNEASNVEWFSWMNSGVRSLSPWLFAEGPCIRNSELTLLILSAVSREQFFRGHSRDNTRGLGTNYRQNAKCVIFRNILVTSILNNCILYRCVLCATFSSFTMFSKIALLLSNSKEGNFTSLSFKVVGDWKDSLKLIIISTIAHCW